MHPVRLEPTTLILVGTRTSYQAARGAGSLTREQRMKIITVVRSMPPDYSKPPRRAKNKNKKRENNSSPGVV